MRAPSTRRTLGCIVALWGVISGPLAACSLDFRQYEPRGGDAATGFDVDVPTAVDTVSSDAPEATIDDVSNCGFVGESCCATDMCLVGVCSSGQCAPCGATDQPCCDSSVCNAALTCSASHTCEPPCGAPGQPCCSGTTCNTGAMCSAGTCAACGDEGGRCCNGGTCATSFNCLTVLDPSGRCTPCGGPGEFCCTAGTPCGGGATCTAVSGVSICVVAGTRVLGGECNPAVNDCPANGDCDPSSALCFECGRYGEWCCDLGVACVANPNFSCRSFNSATFCY